MISLIKKLVYVGAGIALTEYSLHKFGYQNISQTIRSYHIIRDDLFFWPDLNSNRYPCTDYYSACSEYENCVKNDPETDYKLVSYPTTIQGFLWSTIIRKVGVNPIVHEE